jgi:hypothetical protein
MKLISCEKIIFAALLKKFRTFCGNQHFISMFVRTPGGMYAEPYECSPPHTYLFKIQFLILSSHLRPYWTRILFRRSLCVINFVYILISAIRATCLANSLSLYFEILIIFSVSANCVAFVCVFRFSWNFSLPHYPLLTRHLSVSFFLPSSSVFGTMTFFVPWKSVLSSLIAASVIFL